MGFTLSPLTSDEAYASALVVGFVISLLLWILKYYTYALLGMLSGAWERRLKGELLDNIFVILLAVVLSISVSHLGLMGLPGLSSSEEGAVVTAVDVVAKDIDSLIQRVESLMANAEATAQSTSILYGSTFSLLGVPVFTGTETRFADYFAQSTSFYFLLQGLSVLLYTTKALFQLFSIYAPWLILFGAVVRAYPLVKAFGGFMMALGVAMAIYPIVFVSLFSTPTLPSVSPVPQPTFCSLQGFSPITLSASSSAAVSILFSSIGSNVLEVVKELYVVYLLRHIISLALSLQVLRVGSIILSGQTLLTSSFESRLLGAL